MNNQRRKKLNEACSLLSKAATIVDCVKDEEQDSMDNMPESLQDSERYSIMEDAVDAMDDALNSINEASECIEKARYGN